jgi:hypothetical protein
MLLEELVDISLIISEGEWKDQRARSGVQHVISRCPEENQETVIIYRRNDLLNWLTEACYPEIDNIAGINLFRIVKIIQRFLATGPISTAARSAAARTAP